MNDTTESSLLMTLLERLQVREGLEVEFKSARGGLPKSLWPTISAFANTIGGWILLGIQEAGGNPVIEGVPNATALLQNFYDAIRNQQKISHSVCGPTDARAEYLDGKQVMVLRVPATSRKNRPVYINGNPYGGTYVRRAGGDYHCTKQEVDRMMREASENANDAAIVSGFTLDELDDDSITRYRRRYLTDHASSPWSSYDTRGFLRAIGAFRRDHEAGSEGLTVAGLLLLGRPEAIREWRSRHLVDYRQIPEEGGSDTRWVDRVPWDGNLLGAFDTIYPRLTQDLPVPFRLEGARRIDEGPAHIALREALVNLLVHADYAEAQASLISRSFSSYMFRNPGSSRVSETDLLTGDRSDPRNPELARMFRLIGLAEEAGTGIPRILQTWRELGFQLPAIDVGTERYEFTLRLRPVHLLGAEDRAWLHSFGETWTETEQLALVYARHEGAIDNLTLRRLTGHHPSDATKILGGLRDRGLLQMDGRGRGAWYQLGPSAASGSIPQLATGGPGPVDDANASLPQWSPDLTQLNLGETASSSGHSHSDSGDLPHDSGDMAPVRDDAQDTSDFMSADLVEISSIVRDRAYVDTKTRNDTIVLLCSHRPLSLQELAALLDRSPDSLRAALRSLVEAGRLAYLYPERRNHPRQKYRVPEPPGRERETCQ
jgi:ATP-dependent DNA helicase RecG